MNTSSELKKYVELWSLITALFVIIMMVIGFILFIFAYISTDKIEKKSNVHINIIKTEPFGIITHEDIFINNMEKGRYTKHGRLID